MKGMNGKRPKIRFPEFTDDWEKRKLGDVIAKLTGGASIAPDDYVEDGYRTIPKGAVNDTGVANMSGCKNVSESFFMRNISSKTSTGELVTSLRDLVPTAPNMGRIVRICGEYEDFLMPQGVYSIILNENMDEDFLIAYSNSPEYRKIIMTEKNGSTQVHIRNGEFLDIDIPIPSFEEQRKIGKFFSDFDNRIFIYQEKLEHLKLLKKSLLQKMFPKKGEEVPEFRFPGFTDDWEQHKFQDCYKMSSGFAFKYQDYCDDGVSLINGESIQHGHIEDSNLNHLPYDFIEKYADFVLHEKDIVVGLNRPITNGNLKIARIPHEYNNSLLYQRAGKIQYKLDIDKKFSYVLLSKEILSFTLKEAVGSDQPFISTSKLDKWDMTMPKSKEEQTKIGNFFVELDNLITLHQRKLEHIKELKKYMLQNMFV